MNSKVFTTIFLFFLVTSGFSQVNVAISDFLNKSETLYLDAWERSIPDILRSQLSSSKNLVILDRNKLDKILQEQALSLSGLSESGSAQSIGKLLDADFILSGSIDHQNDEYVISADLVRVKTGEVQTEIIRSENKDYKNQMVDMLANNLLYRLTGDGEYKDEVLFKSHSIWYWTGTTLLLTGATVITNNYYNENLDKYNKAVLLKDFDKYHDKATLSKNFFIGFSALTGIAVIATLIDLIGGDTANKIQSGKKNSVLNVIEHKIYFAGKDEIRFALQFNL